MEDKYERDVARMEASYKEQQERLHRRRLRRVRTPEGRALIVKIVRHHAARKVGSSHPLHLAARALRHLPALLLPDRRWEVVMSDAPHGLHPERVLRVETLPDEYAAAARADALADHLADGEDPNV